MAAAATGIGCGGRYRRWAWQLLLRTDTKLIALYAATINAAASRVRAQKPKPFAPYLARYK